jgi:hypothetical protein
MNATVSFVTVAKRFDIVRRRMKNERLLGAPFATPEDAVRWFGAVQAQDYSAAKWALGQRVRRCTDSDVEKVLQNGKVLRTHVMRPTWHFVMPADVRWMLELTAPRVNAAMAYYSRKLELDDTTFSRSNDALAKALAGGNHLTRDELAQALERVGIHAEGQRLGHLVMRAELDAVICSGPRRGKQFTYALLDERAPSARKLARDEALAELAKRYFTSHGPALLGDFAWWSGLKVADARSAIEMVKARLVQEVFDGKTYWFTPGGPTAKLPNPTVHLLPNYDEYLIAYKDHSGSFDPAVLRNLDPNGNVLDNHIIVLNGQVIGGWRRLLAKDAITIETKLLTRLKTTQKRALLAAAKRYGEFLELPTVVVAAKGYSI